jgi:HSP20 family protein
VAETGHGQEGHHIPINSWMTDHELVVEAPMPGIKPENIMVNVRGKSVNVPEEKIEIRGMVSGTHGEGKDYVSQEWHLGPYQRTLDLPCPVNAEIANANFGDGVLIVRLPRAEETRPALIRLHRTGPGQGEAAGHAGQDAHPRPESQHEHHGPAT